MYSKHRIYLGGCIAMAFAVNENFWSSQLESRIRALAFMTAPVASGWF